MVSRSTIIFAAIMGCHKPAPIHADASAEECIGAADAPLHYVYLHGRDTREPSAEEREIRRTLARVASERGARFALPRSDRPCPDAATELCWGWKLTSDELAATARVAEQSAKRCFGDAKYALVGFSNGGYALTKMFERCKVAALLPHADGKLITIGATMLRGPIGSEAASDLSSCGNLTMLVGTKDEWNFDPSDNYLHELLERHANVTETRAEGVGHEVAYEPLRAAL